MRTASTLLTAVALLWHTLAGCCAHAQGEPCAGHSHAVTSVTDEHEHSHGCSHDHDDSPTTESEPADSEQEGHGEQEGHEAPVHPCQCHCDGNRCVAVASPAGWHLDAPQATFDSVSGACSATLVEIATASRHNGGHWAPLDLALPVRAHLFYQILLI